MNDIDGEGELWHISAPDAFSASSRYFNKLVYSGNLYFISLSSTITIVNHLMSGTPADCPVSGRREHL